MSGVDKPKITYMHYSCVFLLENALIMRVKVFECKYTAIMHISYFELIFNVNKTNSSVDIILRLLNIGREN